MRPGSIIGPQQQFLAAAQPHIFVSGADSPIWKTLPESYKQFVPMLHDTQDKVDTEVSEEELLIAMQGDHNQGALLLRQKLTV